MMARVGPRGKPLRHHKLEALLPVNEMIAETLEQVKIRRFAFPEST